MALPAPKKISAKPTAELAPRAGDRLLNSDELRQFELFRQLKKTISVEKFPGSIVLRKFRQGDTICRQGDRGHSAFYIASAEDMRRLRALSANEDQVRDEPASTNTGKRRVATAYLLSGDSVAKPGFFTGFLAGGSPPTPPKKPTSIPNDGPTDIDYETRQAPMLEGDVFGEMSCMTLAPRSATIVVDEDCYMIEFLRNIFDKVQSDTGYRKRADAVYAQRVLSTHLGRLEIFQGLTESQLSILREAAHLEVVDPGTVICDEGDRSDSVYLVRSGVVQVVRGAHVALHARDVADWRAFCNTLLEAEQEDSSGDSGPPLKASKKTTSDSKATENVADILAAARAGKAKSTAAPSKGSSVADILAAARAGKKDGSAPTDATASGAQSAETTKAEADAKSAESAGSEIPAAKNSDPNQKKSDGPRTPADIMAAARASAAGKSATGKSAAKAGPPTAQKAKRPAKPGMSTAEILAAAKKTTVASLSDVEPTDAGPENDGSDGDSDQLLAATTPKPTGGSRRCVWNWFVRPVQAAIRSIANDQGSDADRELVIRAINALICRREFVAAADLATIFEHPDVVDIVSSFPHGVAGASKQWSELEVRIAGSLALRTMFPETFARRARQTGPPDILAYLSRGDCFGEMALVLDAPRQATCIAYDHPTDDSKRKPGRVELVRIDGAAFKHLLESSTALQAKVDQLVSRRFVDIVGGDLRGVGTADAALTHSAAYRDLGLAQGQNLLLIDLDRCTRCGDCVRACENTHSDGYSRLFLDGPTFDRFLIPSACRQCLNPACMIGCPVGSIQRGENGQIEIRDWCIGCNLCADQCPYDSIQMHDLGIIPEKSVGWQFAPLSAIRGKSWQSRGYRGRNWAAGVAPFSWTLDIFDQLASQAPAGVWQSDRGALPEPICFRYPFELSRTQVKKGPFGLHVSSSEFDVRVWINGREIVREAPDNPKKKIKLDELQARLARSDVRVGSNVLAVQVSRPSQQADEEWRPKYNQHLLTMRLDALPQVGELAKATAGEGVDLEVELVKRRAVVCDLCSSLTNSRPACVDQCPHEAAIRINAQYEFPAT